MPPKDKAENQARHFARIVQRRATRARDERGYRVPEGTGEVEDTSGSPAEDAGRCNYS